MDLPALTGKFRKIIIANELDNNLAFALRFSDPDGVRSGKSGWSFGICQFDLNNNSAATTCLLACGFTPAEIAALKAQTIDVHTLEPKLRANAATISRWDEIQLSGCLTRAQGILLKYGIHDADPSGILAVADYDNQYHLSDIYRPGYLVHYLVNLGRPFTAVDVLDFKVQHTPYGQKHPKDCQRRYDNLMKVLAQ